MSRHLFPVTLQKIIEIAENKTVANPFLLVTDLLLQLGIQFQYRSQVSPTAQTSSIPFPFYLISSESADPWSPFLDAPEHHSLAALRPCKFFHTTGNKPHLPRVSSLTAHFAG